MYDSAKVDKQCATALLEAWCRNDSVLIGELAAQARFWVQEFYVTDPGESERLELLSAIASALHHACSLPKSDGVDPYIRLLLHLADPDALCALSTHTN